LVVSPLARRHAFFLFHAHLDDRDLFVFVCVCVPMRSRNVCVEWEGVSPSHVPATNRMPVDPDSLVSLAAAKV
jgi:hypothetical protein